MPPKQFLPLAWITGLMLTGLIFASGRAIPELPLLTRLLVSEFGAFFSLGMIWFSLKHYRLEKNPRFLFSAVLNALFALHFFWYGSDMWIQAFKQ